MNSLPHLDRPILIAGFGSIGRRHFRNLKELGYRQFLFLRTGRSTIDDDEIATYPSSPDLEELLGRRPFAAVIANPSSLHVPIAQAAAEAGCHLLIEKPVSHTLEGCRRLQETCEVRGLTTMIGCQFRFHPLFITLDEMLRSGEIGHVVGARAEWGEYLPGWHPWEDHRNTYAARADLGGGVVLTLIHPFDYLFKLFGPVRSVRATAGRVPSLETSCEDWIEATLQFASGVFGQIHLDYVQRPPVHQLTVWGDAGRMLLDFHAGTLRTTAVDGRTAERTTPPGFERNTMFLDELRHFLACIVRGEQSSIPLADGIAVLQTALEAKRSAELASAATTDLRETAVAGTT